MKIVKLLMVITSAEAAFVSLAIKSGRTRLLALARVPGTSKRTAKRLRRYADDVRNLRRRMFRRMPELRK